MAGPIVWRAAMAAAVLAFLFLACLLGVVLASALEVGPWEPTPYGELLRDSFPSLTASA